MTLDPVLHIVHFILYRNPMEAKMPDSPIPPNLVAQSRHLVTNAQDYAHLPGEELRDLLETAWGVLVTDRRRRTGRAQIFAANTPFPGDAA